jgi:hypothetical protein
MVKHLFKPVVLALESNNSKSHVQNRSSSEEAKNDVEEGGKKLKTSGKATLATTKTIVPENGDKTNYSMVHSY